ncbi:hypothetical protein [Methylococcus sp. EFPC2]|uniref:hypothetical protein n=1 Tax=Methylococcus sp. EFPC2 TaxID=2812648 RepID=UPI0019677EB3|nr:hypothetical protein [Methylococcus sp. EFPC2]QSA98616.1 hypothetical protein JWZ97_07435 [Methylococcus sp. EFPC2]
MRPETQRPRPVRQPDEATFQNRRPKFTTTSSPIGNLLSRLDGVRQTDREDRKFLARCPAHDDRSPSLGIRETDDGRVLLKCWAGCSFEQITSAIGLSVSDLFPVRHGRDFDPNAPKPRRPKFSAYELLPLVITEAMVLALAYRELAHGGTLSDADLERAELAEHAVMGAWAEVKCYG